MHTAMPTFDEFYKAINGRPPFPWQSRLANQIASTGRWYSEIGIPTGLGKTTCLDIAIWWLASQAECEPAQRIAPTRIWWVVNRRLLVDSTFAHACKIGHMLRNPDHENFELKPQERQIIKIVADRLRHIAGYSSAEPLEVIRLRGGIASHRPSSPSQPAILLATLPMYGSRLLFRGYGSSSGMRSIDAAMAGTDSLILLDEAHLTPHLRTLHSAIAACTPDIHPILNEARLRATLVQLTATGDPASEDRFLLNEEDEKHPEIKKRLNATKLLEIRVVKNVQKNKNPVAEATFKLLQHAPPATCIVFCNTPRIARMTFGHVTKLMKNAEVLLLTGRIREREAGQMRQRILEGMHSSDDKNCKRTQHLIVVATQTLEVGADIDAEYLVTEQCGVRALTQRLGRLNRFGRFEEAHAVYVHTPTDSRKNDVWPVYGKEPQILLGRLDLHRKNNASKLINLSPAHVQTILGSPCDGLNSSAPELLPGILWEWIKTSYPVEGEAPVEPYFSGISGTQKFVSVIWRAHVPKDRNRLWPRASDRESIDVPIGEFRNAWKKSWGSEKVSRLGSDGITVEEIELGLLRPRDQIVLRSDCGLMDEFGWNHEATDPVLDVSLNGHGLPLNAEAFGRIGITVDTLLQDLLNTVLGKSPHDAIEIAPQEQIDAMAKILRNITESVPHGWAPEEWGEFVNSLDVKTGVLTPYKEVSRLKVMKSPPEKPNDNYDERSLAYSAVKLEPHGEAVSRLTQSICDRIGISGELTEVVRFAGKLHDIGKADERFQRWLDPDWHNPDTCLAKSDTPYHKRESRRIASGWPRHGRHESLSAHLVRAWLNKNPQWGDSMKRKLLVHLIISHHGKGRPIIKPVADNTSLTIDRSITGEVVSAPADLRIVDWEQPSRFQKLNEHFGPWGLALLEAILRLSDHAVSAGINIPSNTD